MKGMKKIDSLKLDLADAKAFHELKTNIQFLTPKEVSKVIMITSSDGGEGKSTVATNLSLTLAQSGKKTILIDCNQKKPSIHNIFNISNDKGLLDLLLQEADFKSSIQTTEQNHLFILTAGTKSLNYAEYLDSSKFSNLIESLREQFEYIIIDTASLNEGADTKSILKYADGCVLVIGAGQTERKSALKAKETLQKANINILGVFLNKSDY